MALVAIVTLLTFTSVTADSSPWAQDLLRAQQMVPRAEWRGAGSLASANARLNKHIAARVGIRLKVCEEFAIPELRDLLRMLHGRASDGLKEIYAPSDGRVSQYADIAAMEAHWASHAPADDVRVRDAHCHEVVMWFVHHLTSDAQQEAMQEMVLPTLPVRDHTNTVGLRGSEDKAGAFYKKATTCQKCHVGGGGQAPMVPVVVTDADKPPVWAARFHVQYTEYTSMMKPFPWQKSDVNEGSLHYDVQNMRQVWLHGKGQTDNWCQCAGLKTDEACSLIASPSAGQNGGGTTYVYFKELGKCCTLGKYDEGFGPLATDWLKDGAKIGVEQVENNTCTTWAGGPPGDWFMMVSDDWSVDEHGRPCKYADHFKSWAKTLLGMSHSYTFHTDTYSETEEDDSIFAVPEGVGCEQACPNKEGWCSASKK